MIGEQVSMRFQTGGECGSGVDSGSLCIMQQTSNLEMEFGGIVCGWQPVGRGS